MSLRIAIVAGCAYPVPQGSQVYLGETARALRLRGHDARLVVYGHGTGEAPGEVPVHRAAGLPGYTRTAAGPSWVKPMLDVALAHALRRVVRGGIDVVCAHNYEGLLAALLARTRPVVYFAHTLLEEELPLYSRHGRAGWARLGRWLDYGLPRRADAAVAPHRHLAEALVARGCRAERVHVVPPPVDTGQFDVCQHGAGTPPVLYAGNLDAYQNLPLLFEAMRLLRARRPEVRFRIATADTGPIGEAERVPVVDLGALRAVLREDAVFAVPRVSAVGYPIKLLNAMAAGQAIVACAGAAHPLTDGENGLVVADGDAAGFAGAIERLLEDGALRARLGTAARRAAEETHSLAAAGRALEAVLEPLAAGRG